MGPYREMIYKRYTKISHQGSMLKGPFFYFRLAGLLRVVQVQSPSK